MHILFLTASTGGGHVKAAQALMEYMEQNIPGCRTTLVDALKYIDPLIDRLIAGTYLQTIKKAPKIYGMLYSISEKHKAVTNIVKTINALLAPKLAEIFSNDPPGAVICAHTMPLQMVSALKRAGSLNIPIVGIVTDYTNHYFWKLDEPDALIVAHERIKSDMIKMGIREEKIHVFGIPVSGRFCENHAKHGSGSYIGKNKQSVLLMGGSLGLCNMEKVFAALLGLDHDIRIVAVAGYNAGLRRRLEKMASGSGKDACIYGYTDNICGLMDASSLIITKPGGVTVSEALIKRLPIFIIDPIPGQEERNAEFLIESGAACMLSQSDNLHNVLTGILDSQILLKRMSEAAGKLAKPNACEDITQLVIQLAYKDENMSMDRATINMDRPARSIADIADLC